MDLAHQSGSHYRQVKQTLQLPQIYMIFLQYVALSLLLDTIIRNFLLRTSIYRCYQPGLLIDSPGMCLCKLIDRISVKGKRK